VARRTGIAVRVEAPDRVPDLPASVEVALCRITDEALTNVSRHADAHRCTVRFDLDARHYPLEIHDDGRGITATDPAGVGTTSMRERAAELGGSMSISAGDGGGTAVRVALPRQTP
jgi:two-component system NarL family sensor kinase